MQTQANERQRTIMTPRRSPTAWSAPPGDRSRVRPRTRRFVLTAALAVVDALVLSGLWPDWAALGRHLVHADAWSAAVGADQAAAAVVAAALWLCAAWTALGLLAVGLAAAPGGFGVAGRRIVTLIVPATV